MAVNMGLLKNKKKHEDHTQSCIISDDMNMIQCSIKMNHTIEIIEGPYFTKSTIINLQIK